MTGPTIAVEQIPEIGHDEAMNLAATEYDRVLGLADDLVDDDWSRPTDCTDWDVKDMLGHLLGMFEQHADAEERTRQFAAAAGIARQTGGIPLDEMTALQVREHADLSTAGADSVAARRRATSAHRAPRDDRRAASRNLRR